jgi:hypothetical protein
MHRHGRKKVRECAASIVLSMFCHLKRVLSVFSVTRMRTAALPPRRDDRRKPHHIYASHFFATMKKNEDAAIIDNTV